MIIKMFIVYINVAIGPNTIVWFGGDKCGFINKTNPRKSSQTNPGKQTIVINP